MNFSQLLILYSENLQMTEYEDISVEKTIISMFHHMAFFFY